MRIILLFIVVCFAALGVFTYRVIIHSTWFKSLVDDLQHPDAVDESTVASIRKQARQRATDETADAEQKTQRAKRILRAIGE
jgi:hypothetical protein